MLCWTASLGIQVAPPFNSVRCHTQGMLSTAICVGCGVYISSKAYNGNWACTNDIEIMLTKLHLCFCRSFCRLQSLEWQCVSASTLLRSLALPLCLAIDCSCPF